MASGRERSTLWVILMVILVCSCCWPAHAEYGGGSGTADDPYQIWTPEQMNAIGAEPNDWDKHFKLMADIDLSAFDGQEGRAPFNIIGPDNVDILGYPPGKPFSGVFDGNGHTISNFRCDTERRDYVGLFGCVGGPGADIRRLRLVNPTVNAQKWGGSCVGSLVGLLLGGIVMGCSVEGGTISGLTRVGGLVGENQGHVTQCYSVTTVTAEGEVVGGLVGANECLVAPNDYWGMVTQCWSASSVNGHSRVAGLIARNSCTVVRCYSFGRVSCSPGGHAGGLIDDNRRFRVVRDCFWDMHASGQANSAAGTGLTTAQMQNIRTYLDAGWDWAGETENGTCELWQIPQEGGYPRLTIFGDYTPLQLKGLGTPEDPYRVANAGELGAMVHYSPYACYRLDASVDLSGIRWRTAAIPWFAGTFDGNGMTLLHAQIEGVDFPALFGQLGPGAEVKDVAVVDVNITASEVALVGGLAGGNAGTLTRCYSSGRVAGNPWFVGGLVGENLGVMIQCHSTCAVGGNQNAGGLVGHNHGSLTRCHSTGAVNARFGIGGLVGNNEGSVAECYSTSPCAGEGHIGGLVGDNRGELTDCYSTGAVSGYASGGLVGCNRGGVLHCYSTGQVDDLDLTGGLVGYNDSAVTGCFWDTQTSGFRVSAGGQGKTTAELQQAATFLGWGACDGEGVWIIAEGKDYPRLRWEGGSGRVLPTTALSDLLQGDGTKGNPFQIHTPEELNTVGLFPCEWGKHYRLMADIDLSACTGTQFNNLGTDSPHAFTGVFDGNGHVISSFTYQTNAYVSIVGLFGCVDAPAEIRDVCLIAPAVHAIRGHDMGALAGSLRGGTVSRCRVEGGAVTGSHTTGGLIGSNRGGTIAHCRVTAAVDSGYETGGLVGWNRGIVTGCLDGGTVMGGDATGGLVGWNRGTITECCTTEFVVGRDFTGGLTGLHDDGTIANCYSTAPVLGWRRVGGLTGLNAGTITACYSAGTVAGDTMAGGLVGGANEGFMSNSFWDIEASGQDSSAGGTGKTTAQMRMAATFVDSDWDFARETANGTEDTWWIDEGEDYPRLWWETAAAAAEIQNSNVEIRNKLE